MSDSFRYTKLVFKADPCKKCLVRPCCSKYCEEKRELNSIHNCGTIWLSRLLIIGSWVGILSFPVVMFFTWFRE